MPLGILWNGAENWPAPAPFCLAGKNFHFHSHVLVTSLSRRQHRQAKQRMFSTSSSSCRTLASSVRGQWAGRMAPSAWPTKRETICSCRKCPSTIDATGRVMDSPSNWPNWRILTGPTLLQKSLSFKIKHSFSSYVEHGQWCPVTVRCCPV